MQRLTSQQAAMMIASEEEDVEHDSGSDGDVSDAEEPREDEGRIGLQSADHVMTSGVNAGDNGSDGRWWSGLEEQGGHETEHNKINHISKLDPTS